MEDLMMSTNNIYGYCRISTPNQSLERQERNIRNQYPNAIIYNEVFTGRKLERPTWTMLYKKLKPGDTIVFDEVSRMSRDADEGFNLYQELFERGINLIFLKEPHINTEVYRESLKTGIDSTGVEIADIFIEATNKVLMVLAKEQLKMAFAEAQKEVDFLRQRTREGMATAALHGKQIGSVKGSVYKIKNKEPICEIIRKKSKTFEGNNTDAEVIAIINSSKYTDAHGVEKMYHISNNTYYKYKKEMVMAETTDEV